MTANATAGPTATNARKAVGTSIPSIRKSAERAGWRAINIATAIGAVNQPPETKSPETTPANVLATPEATATQKGPIIDSGLLAQTSSDPPNRSPDAKTPATPWSRWI